MHVLSRIKLQYSSTAEAERRRPRSLRSNSAKRPPARLRRLAGDVKRKIARAEGCAVTFVRHGERGPKFGAKPTLECLSQQPLKNARGFHVNRAKEEQSKD
jgi:hypothetical protein